MSLSRAFLFGVVACGLAAGPVEAGAGRSTRASSSADAETHLVINRAPNFGNYSNISLYIDGNLAGVLGYGRNFHGVVQPGRHLITMMQTPHLNDAYPVHQQWIRVAPGETSVFTAIWRGGGTRIALE